MWLCLAVQAEPANQHLKPILSQASLLHPEDGTERTADDDLRAFVGDGGIARKGLAWETLQKKQAVGCFAPHHPSIEQQKPDELRTGDGPHVRG